MDLETVKRIIFNQWKAEKHDILTFVVPGEAKFVTGYMRVDQHLHYLEIVAGLRLVLSREYNDIIGYSVVDSKQFVLFALKWS